MKNSLFESGRLKHKRKHQNKTKLYSKYVCMLFFDNPKGFRTQPTERPVEKLKV